MPFCKNGIISSSVFVRQALTVKSSYFHNTMLIDKRSALQKILSPDINKMIWIVSNVSRYAGIIWIENLA